MANIAGTGEWVPDLENKRDEAEIINLFLEHKSDTLIKIEKKPAEEITRSYLQVHHPERAEELMSKLQP
jgi:hypothetical protein